MGKEDLKLFVGGYYDSRRFEGDFYDGKTPFDKHIDTYTLDEALAVGFVEPVIEWFEDKHDKSWDEGSFEEKAKAIEEYTYSDDIAGMLYFPTEEEAEKYKQKALNELARLELMSKYKNTEQEQHGTYKEVYAYSLEDVLSLQEAADMWGLDDSTLRHGIARGRFEEGEYRKTGRNYILKKSAMERVYGEEKKERQ